MDRDTFVKRLAVNFDNLDMIHPFREGNGRTQRTYWTFVAHEAGCDIPWSRISKQENIQASREAITGETSGLENMFGRVVRPYDPERRERLISRLPTAKELVEKTHDGPIGRIETYDRNRLQSVRSDSRKSMPMTRGYFVDGRWS
ncbi:Fic family protein [uncultured Bifidobacterium sp.]|uniref:Fic family protein n=1 Tax=uncultured Bifidobacterium sp. TaxID=165187 RepID=UPI0025ECD091|nr:Fic family protein [uncultured Bifidobacterium sp.]